MSMTPEVVTVSPTAAASTTTINIATPAHIHVFVPRTSGSFNPHLVHIYFTFVRSLYLTTFQAIEAISVVYVIAPPTWEDLTHLALSGLVDSSN